MFQSRACSDTALNLVKLQPLAKCGDNAVSKTGLIDLFLKSITIPIITYEQTQRLIFPSPRLIIRSLAQ